MGLILILLVWVALTVACFPKYRIFKILFSKSSLALDLLNQFVPSKIVSSIDSITCRLIGITMFWMVIFTYSIVPKALALVPFAVTTIVLEGPVICNPSFFISLAVTILTAAPESKIATTRLPLILIWHLIAVVFLSLSDSK